MQIPIRAATLLTRRPRQPTFHQETRTTPGLLSWGAPDSSWSLRRHLDLHLQNCKPQTPNMLPSPAGSSLLLANSLHRESSLHLPRRCDVCCRLTMLRAAGFRDRSAPSRLPRPPPNQGPITAGERRLSDRLTVQHPSVLSARSPASRPAGPLFLHRPCPAAASTCHGTVFTWPCRCVPSCPLSRQDHALFGGKKGLLILRVCPTVGTPQTTESKRDRRWPWEQLLGTNTHGCLVCYL